MLRRIDLLFFMRRLDLVTSVVFLGVAAITVSSQGKSFFRSATIVTEPNAAVWIDGVRYGTTDEKGRLIIRSVSPGRHAVRVSADGFSEATKPLLPAQKGDFHVKLSKTANTAELAFQEGERQSLLDRQKAAEAYRKAIGSDPKHAAAHVALARVLAEGGDVEGALKAVAELKKVSPTNPEAFVIEGRIYKDIDDEKRSIAAFKRAITLGKGFQPEAYTGLGLLYKENAEGLGGDTSDPATAAAYNEAIKNFSIAVRQLSGAPDAIVVFQLLGLIQERQGKLREAIATYEDFLRVFPDVSEAEAVRSFIVQIKKQLAEQGQ